MFGYRNAKMGYGVKADDRWGEYAGEGIWAPCADCGTLHQIEESADFRTLVDEQCQAVSASSHEVYSAYRITEPDGRWDVNEEQARFTFTHADKSQCHARYGVIGSYNPDTHSWMWAWHFPDHWMPARATALSRKLLELGLARDWKALTEPLLVLNEHEAWHMTNLGAWIAGYPMVYRANVNDVNAHYFAIDRPVWLS